jgi:HAD superfamily hydrolase (TIGR01662 family)
MFESVEALAFDLGDTLITVEATHADFNQIWQTIYSFMQQVEGPNLAPLSDIRHHVDEHVDQKLREARQSHAEIEQDMLELFSNALRAAGLAHADDQKFVYNIVEMRHRAVERFIRVGPHVKTTLAELKQRGYKLGLVSNFCNITEAIYQTIENLGLLIYFDATVISCEIGWRKPSPHIYEAICQRLQVEPTKILFNGDRLVEDVAGPQRAGMQAVLSQELRQEDPTTTEIKPNLIIQNIQELLDYLPNRL